MSADRIKELRERYHREVPKISIERARFFTEKWRETKGGGLSQALRVALSMKEVYEKMTHHVEPHDLLAGYWTEDFLGIPIDIERGVFNKVLETELDKRDMIRFRIKALGASLLYMVKNHSPFELLKMWKKSRSQGPSPLNLGLETMMERAINPFSIDRQDKEILKGELLPYWKGKTLVDLLEKEIFQSDSLSPAMRNFSKGMPINTSRQTLMISPCATIATLQGHVIIDYERALKKGLFALKKDVEDKLLEDDSISDLERETLQSFGLALEGIIIFSTRLGETVENSLAAEGDEEKRKSLKVQIENCKVVPLYPPRTFHQAVQSAWTLKTALELAHPVNLHSFGRMDQIFYPYYKRDLDQGRITSDEAREIIEELLLKIMSQNLRPESGILSNFYHRYLGSSPITIGGLKTDGTDGTNDLTYLFLEAAEGSRAVTNLSLRLHKGTPQKVYSTLVKVLQKGCSSLSLFNDEVNTEAMKRRGFSEEDSRDYAVMGCVELLCPGKTGGMSANALLLSRLLDMTLRNGDSQTLMGYIPGVGLETGAPDSFEKFEDLLEAFLKQARHQMEGIARASNLRDRLFESHLPAPHLSAFLDGCLDNKRDVTAGGARYDLSGISFINSIANLVDSLYSIKKLVFEEKSITFKELLRALDQNFKGYVALHQRIRGLEGKWGNGNPEVDGLARRVTDELFLETYQYRSHRGGAFVPYVISMITHTIDGRLSIATADGREAARPYAASCNPYNVEKSGVTGVMKSVASLDFRQVLGGAVNVKFHPSALGSTQESHGKWISLIQTYFQLGGAQLQPTVVSAEMLKEAREDPDEYRDLIIKVGGYSTYFTDLGREIQDEIIERTEHGVV